MGSTRIGMIGRRRLQKRSFRHSLSPEAREGARAGGQEQDSRARNELLILRQFLRSARLNYNSHLKKFSPFAANRGPMSEAQWNAVDRYLAGLFVGPDAALEAALAASDAAGLPQIAVSPTHGKMLHLLARSVATQSGPGARKILEIGTLGGYSTIWMARALPADGRLITLEADPKHAEVARANIARAGMAGKVEVRLGKALDTLPGLVAEAPFDLVFIDADKTGYSDYLAWSLKLTRRGSLIIADNVVRKGAVSDPNSDDANVQGVRRFNQMLAAEPRVSATAIQTVGSKGYDGFAIAVVIAE
jgi:predicted O-methyltransferase YrrM